MTSNDGNSNAKKDLGIHITYDDQLKINSFANAYTKLEELTDDLDMKKIELQNLEDSISELDMILDEEELLPIKIGDVFMYCSLSECQEKTQEIKKDLQAVVKTCEEQTDILKGKMLELKTTLYAKFGNKIHLESDKDDY